MSVRNYLLLLLSSYSLYTNGATIIGGNATIPDETVTFLFNTHAQDRQGTTRGIYPVQIGEFNFFGADSTAVGVSQEFALSVIARGQNTLSGIARKEATIIGQTVDNPLYNNGIAFLDLMEGAEGITGDAIKPVVVTTTDLTTIYLVNSYIGSTTELVPAPNAPDATGAVTTGIVGLAAANNYIFSAVKPHAPGSLFGDNGSGIALTILGFTQQAVFGFLDAPTGTVTSLPRALPLDRTSSVIAIGSTLDSIGQVVALYWDFLLQRVYIALQVTGGSGITDGAIAVVVGRIQTDYVTVDDKQVAQSRILTLNPIAPVSAFDTAGNKIVGNIGANSAISVQKIATMQTSTLMHYLIVQGDVGTAGTTNTVVYALPLVSGASDENSNGTIAQKDAVPTVINGVQNYVVARTITTAATTPADMTLSSDAAARVGGGALTAGPITDLVIRNDTIFATVSNPSPGFSPGIYASTALFESNGKIKGWTTWRRAVTTITNNGAPQLDPVDGALLDPVRGNFLVITHNNSGTQTIIKETSWGSGDTEISAPLITAMNQQFPHGINALFDIPYTGIGATPGLYDISLLIATGTNNVLVAQTGASVPPNTNLLPSSASDYATVEHFTNGAITTGFSTINNTKIITVSGGVLENIGVIQAAEIIQGGIGGLDGYFVVGGSNGVAILSRPDGSAWPVTSNLANGFMGLTDDMNFKILGNYTNVRKLMYDYPYLYVLTDTTFDRIDTAAGNIGLNSNLSITTIATASTLAITGFLDCLVTNKCALLGTTNGLLRTGDGADVRTATNPSEVLWTSVAIPDGAGPVTKLFPISTDGRAQSMGTNPFGGMVYVVTAYRGYQSARLHRFSLSQVSTGPISQTSFQLIPDFFINTITSYFVDFSQYIGLFATDGALFLSTSEGTSQQGLSLRALPAQTNAWPKTGFRFLGARSQMIPIPFDTPSYATELLKNSATGGFMLAGSFGARIQE